MPVPELEALIYLYETFSNTPNPDCLTAQTLLLSLSDLRNGAPRRSVPDVLPLDKAHHLLSKFIAVEGLQVEVVLEALLGAEWGSGQQREVPVDDLLLLVAFVASDSRAARVHLAFWALDKEGKGHLALQQVIRGMGPLMAVARVGALLQCVSSGSHPSAAFQVPAGSPPTHKLLQQILEASLEPEGPSRTPVLVNEYVFDQLLDHTAAQLSAMLFDQVTNKSPEPPPRSHQSSSAPTGTRQLPPAAQPLSPSTPSYPPPIMVAAIHSQETYSPTHSHETHSTYRSTMEQPGDLFLPPPPGLTFPRGSFASSLASNSSAPHLPTIQSTSMSSIHDAPAFTSRSAGTSFTNLHADPATAQQQRHPHPATPFLHHHLTPLHTRHDHPTHAPQSQVMLPSIHSLALQADRAEDLQRQQIELQRSSRNRRASQRQPAPGGQQAGMYQSIQSTIVDTSFKVFALCSGSLLVLLAVLFMNSALIVFLYKTRHLRLEVALAVTVGFNLGLVGILSCSLVIRSKCAACKAAAAAARSSHGGNQEDIQLDGIIPPFLQPAIKKFLLTFGHEQQRSDPNGNVGDAGPNDGLASKLRAVWVTLGRMAGFDVQAQQDNPVSPHNENVRTPQSESPEFRNTGRHVASAAVPPMRSWGTYVSTSAVREAYRDF